MKEADWKLPEGVRFAVNALERAGFEAWLVGGCVRDFFSGRAPHDYDLCTAATPDETARVFAGQRVLETGRRHGTLTLLLPDCAPEITTYRTEGAYSDGRRPDEVRFVRDIRADLARRDFTVGAMAWHPARGLLDPFGGRSDLQNGILRAVGNAALRFREDALRILRGVRFCAVLGLEAEAGTAAAMRRTMDGLNAVARERVFAEVTRLLCGRYVLRALCAFPDVLGQVMPELQPMLGLDQQNPHHLYDLWEHTARAVAQVPSDPVLRLAMLLHDCGKPACKTVDGQGIGHFYGHPKAGAKIAAGLLTRLRCPGEMRRTVLQLVEDHDKPLGDCEKLVRRRLAQIGEENFRRLLKIKKGDAVGQGTHPEDVAALLETERRLGAVLAATQCFSLRQLAVRGGDLTARGMRGKAVGDMLHTLLDAVIDGQVENDKQALLAFAHTQWRETK